MAIQKTSSKPAPAIRSTKTTATPKPTAKTQTKLVTNFARDEMSTGRGKRAASVVAGKSALVTGTSSGTPRASLRDFSKYLLDQKQTNSCGTTSASMLVNFWNQTPGKVTHKDLDPSIRRGNLFTSPQNLEGWYKDNGFRASAKNNGTLNELASFVEKGVPVQVLYDPTGETASGDKDEYLHYVNVVGIERDRSGKIVKVTIADPAGGVIQTVSVKDFEKRWNNLKFLGKDTGLNNVMIVVLPEKNTRITGSDGTTRNTKDITLPKETGFGIIGGAVDIFSDVANVIGNTVENATDAIGDAAEEVGDFVDDRVDDIGDIVDLFS